MRETVATAQDRYQLAIDTLLGSGSPELVRLALLDREPKDL